MSALYVGQRVRILWSDGWPELAGQEGLIVDRSATPGRIGRSEWRVAPDAWGSYAAPRLSDNGCRFFAPNSEQLEPVIPPGLESLAEINALYEPEPITESAPTQRIADEVSLALETAFIPYR